MTLSWIHENTEKMRQVQKIDCTQKNNILNGYIVMLKKDSQKTEK